MLVRVPLWRIFEVVSVPRSRVIEIMIMPIKPRIRLMRMSVNRVIGVSVAFFSVVMGMPIFSVVPAKPRIKLMRVLPICVIMHVLNFSVVLVMAVAKNHNP